MKKILFFGFLFALQTMQAQFVDDHIRARSSFRIGGNTTTAATGISNAMPGSPSTTLITAKGVYDWFTGVVTFAGDVSGPYNNLVLANTSVTPGTYTNATVTFNAQGRATSASSGSAGATYTAGSGIAISGGNEISNTAPNIVQNLSLVGQALSISGGTGATLPVVNITAGANISVTPVAGSFAVANTAPDQTVGLTNGGGVVVTGTYPNFTITATDQSTTNEIQTLSYSAPNLSISGGNSVDISGNNYWSKATNDLYYTAGNVGIGTTGPDRKLDILDAAGPQIRLSYTDGGAYTDFQTISTGNLTIAPTGGGIALPAVVRIGNSYTNSPALFSFVDNNYSTPNTSGLNLTYFNYNLNAVGTQRHFVWAGNALNPISGFHTNSLLIRSFAPTSGSAIFTMLDINPTINQTGGANGITRGLYINPVLTAAADFRAVEVLNNSGKGFYQTGASATNNFAGKTTIGGTGAPAASSALDVQSTTLGSRPAPPMTQSQRDAIASPAPWLQVICTDCTATDGSTGVLQVYNGSTWKNAW